MRKAYLPIYVNQIGIFSGHLPPHIDPYLISGTQEVVRPDGEGIHWCKCAWRVIKEVITKLSYIRRNRLRYLLLNICLKGG